MLASQYIWVLMLGSGAFSGALNGWLGLGGMSVYVPLLLWRFHASVADRGDLIATVLINAFATVILVGGASWHAHHRQNTIRYDHAAPLAVGSCVGVVSGFFLSVGLGLLASMDVLFGVYLIGVSLFSLQQKIDGKTLWPSWERLVGIGFAGGAAGGLIGFNGNSVFIPALRSNGLNVKAAIATGQLVGIVVAFGMVLLLGVQYGFGKLDFGLCAVLSAGGITGSYVGAILKRRLSFKRMNWALALSYFGAGVVLAFGLSH